MTKKYRKHIKLVLCTCLLLSGTFFSNTLVAQRATEPQNLPKYDQKRIHFGFLLGLNFADISIKQIPGFYSLDTLYSVNSSPAPGFALGIVSNLRLGEYWDFRFLPELAFSQRTVTYSFVRNDSIQNPQSKNVESTYLHFPLLFKFKSARVKNYRMFLLGGFKYSYDLASQEKVKDTDSKQLVKLRRNTYSYEFGFGIDCYLEMFKFSPEIKFSGSLNDLLVKDVSIYSTSIDQIFSQILTISFTFE